ncbi:hypothetical protein ACFSTA_16920 [Ornithinibacillus salinisoli]|uniref:Transposase n=1 Tax=Ornithinibacillus salinisoli TaxID=1848459 RepID=A0ABW4W3M5_9BACI
MGYILPIQQHEYNDYQKRVAKVRRNPYVIEKPFKVVLETQYEEISKKNGYAKDKAADASKTMSEPKVNLQYAKVTGKGKYVNHIL